MSVFNQSRKNVVMLVFIAPKTMLNGLANAKVLSGSLARKLIDASVTAKLETIGASGRRGCSMTSLRAQYGLEADVIA